MKRKEYEKLLDKIEEANLVYGGWVLEYADYDEVRQPLSSKEAKVEMDKAKKILDGYKAELEDILTIDMETFAKDILEYINETHEKEYEIMKYDIDDSKLWVARPKGKRIMDTKELVFDLEDVYVLGKDNTKILPYQAIQIGPNIFPTMCSFDNKYIDAYFVMLGGIRVRYNKFIDFMNEYEDKLVETYIPKKNNKR